MTETLDAAIETLHSWRTLDAFCLRSVRQKDTPELGLLNHPCHSSCH